MGLYSKIASAFAALLVSGSLVSPALASPSMFPTNRTLVPFVVAGAFVLPALVALLFGRLARLGRIAGPAVGISVIALLFVAAAGLAQYGPYSLLRG